MKSGEAKDKCEGSKVGSGRGLKFVDSCAIEAPTCQFALYTMKVSKTLLYEYNTHTVAKAGPYTCIQ